MQKKFQVYDWFKTLDGAKRIDFLNGMLHLCFPLELRFLGSCIEELARKDYLYLRDAELKANSIQEIQQFKDICDKITRSKMIVTLALLSSNNFECARFLFEFLNVDICRIIEKMKSIYLDAKIADEFLLLLTMAANHPAFDFQMKTKMSNLFISTENKLKSEEIICRDNDLDLCSCEKSKISNENMLLNSYLDKKGLKNLNQKDFNELPVKDDNNNNNKNNQDSFDRAKKFEMNDKGAYSTSSSSISSSNTSLNEENDYILKNENKVEKKSENFFDEISTNDDYIESINFEGVRSIKGTNNYKFSIKIQWSDLICSEIHKTYNEICEFNKNLIKIFPEQVTNLLDTNSLVVKEDQKEDFVKEMPLVADYCNKLAKLPKDIFKSELFKSFFPRNFKKSKCDENEKKNVRFDMPTKTDIDLMELDHKSSQKEIIKTENLNCNQNECKKNISKNITISVANVFNKSQKENSSNHYLSKPNKNQKNNSNKSKLMDFKRTNDDVFPNPINKQNLDTFQLPILQPFSNFQISSPSSPPSNSASYQSLNLNPSSSFNNSRCSSPWMNIPSSPLQFNNNLHQLSTGTQTQQQFGKSFQNNQKEFKQENIKHDELLLRYVLDNDANSNICIDMSANQNQDPRIKNQIEIKNPNEATKSQIKQAASISPKANSNNFNSSSSISQSNENQTLQQPQQIYNSVQINNLSTHHLKQIATPLNNVSNNSQFFLPSQFQEPQNLVQYSINNFAPNVASGKIKHPQIPLLIAPVLTKGTSNYSFPYCLNQYGNTSIFSQNIPIIPNMGPHNLAMTSASQISVQDRVLSPSILAPIPVNNINKNNKLSKNNQKSRLNENLQANIYSKNTLKTPSTTSDEDEISKKEDNKINKISVFDNENLKNFIIEEDLDKNSHILNDLDQKEEQHKHLKENLDNTTDKSCNQNKKTFDNNLITQQNYFYNKNDKIISTSDQSGYFSEKNRKTITEFSNKNDTDENADSSHLFKSLSNAENMSTKSSTINFNESHFQNTHLPFAFNNMYYHVPSFAIQDGHNLLNNVSIPNQQVNQHLSTTQNQINQTFQPFSHFNHLPIPISIAPAFGSQNSQITGQLQIHQNNQQHSPFLIPLVAPLNQSNTRTPKDTPTSGTSPTNSAQMTVNHVLMDTNTKSENNILNQSKNKNYSYTQYPFAQNPTADGNYNNLNNLMTSAGNPSPHLQQQHQNMLMMLMMGNNFQGPPLNFGNPNKNINNCNYGQQENYNILNSQNQNFSQNKHKTTKSKKSCYNCGSLNHSAHECREPFSEYSSNSYNFKLNYKPNFTSNPLQNEAKSDNKSLSPKIRNSKISNKFNNYDSNQRCDHKMNN